MRTISIRHRRVGDGAPMYIIAEAGSNHDGHLDAAHALIDAAAGAGVDAVKFQLFRADRLYPRSAGQSRYLRLDSPIYDIIRAMELPVTWLPTLREHAHALGLDFIASPFHVEAVELLAPFVDALKIASYEITHEPLLRAAATQPLPVLLSTGASDLDEVRRAVTVLEEAGCRDLVLLHCTAAYPAPPIAANVRAVQTLRDALGHPAGLSDHTRDPVAAPAAAAALGAAVVEKHFTLDRTRPGPDHRFALEPDELRRMVEVIRAVEEVLGSGDKVVHAAEDELRSFARRSLVATRDIAAGERFTHANVDVLRNGVRPAGLPPSELERVLACVAARDIAAEASLTEQDVALAAAHTVSGPRDLDDELTFRAATDDDAALLFGWANDPLARSGSFHSAAIAWDEHVEWLTGALADPLSSVLIIEAGIGPVGVLRLEDDGAGGRMEVSLTIAPEHRGRGLARRALALAAARARSHGAQSVTARIRPSNVRSIRAFEGAGFRRTGVESVAGAPAVRYSLDLMAAPPVPPSGALA